MSRMGRKRGNKGMCESLQGLLMVAAVVGIITLIVLFIALIVVIICGTRELIDCFW